MLRRLMLISGRIEVLFGVSAILAPALVMDALGGPVAGPLTLAIVRLLGGATLGLGVAALMASPHLDTCGGLATAYGLGLYNVVAAFVLVVMTAQDGTAGLWAGAALHGPIALLFVFALSTRRW